MSIPAIALLSFQCRKVAQFNNHCSIQSVIYLNVDAASKQLNPTPDAKGSVKTCFAILKAWLFIEGLAGYIWLELLTKQR